MRLRIDNRTARRLWLASHGLTASPTRAPDVPAIIGDLGFLQIDTIRNVVRAQDHILWSRAQSYREGAVWDHLAARELAARELFEHFTHDASLIPRSVLPYWTRRFRDLGARAARGAWYQSGLGRDEILNIRKRIETEGALSTRAFDTRADRREMWARPPHKKALDQMWYAGELATCHRENFVKFYDLGRRVLGPLDHGMSEATREDWLHREALSRLGVCSPGELARFWDITRPAEAKRWLERARSVPVEVETFDGGWTAAHASPDIEARIAALLAPGERVRLLNPFDPAIRDRTRTERLFGFSYRNEMFVPAKKRRFGYYVYPLLEGDRFVGRLEAKADKRAGSLVVSGFWPEPGIRWGAGRRARLGAELERFARFGGLSRVTWACPEP